MIYLSFDLSDRSDGTDGITTLEAVATTRAAQHAAVMAEARQVLDWAARHFPNGPGPVEEGLDWDHDLAVTEEAGGWFAVALTLTGSPAFVEALLAAFGPDDEGG